MHPRNMSDNRAMATIFVLGCTKREANTIAAEQTKTMIEMIELNYCLYRLKFNELNIELFFSELSTFFSESFLSLVFSNPLYFFLENHSPSEFEPFFYGLSRYGRVELEKF